MEARTFRVIVANEPRSYREIIAEGFRVLRPHVEVVTVEPMALEREVCERRPDMVICSRKSDIVHLRSTSWILLYPEGEGFAMVSIEGHETVIPNVGFAELLLVLDRVQRLAELS